MKQPVVDYREFRLSRLNEPQFAHLKLLGGWIFYFVMYFITENLIPYENCHVIHCALDDMIPFSEYFLLAYCGWYFLVFGSLLYFLLYNVEGFKQLQTFIIITQVIAMAVYVIYPSRQDLRPETFANDNFLTHLMAFIYAFDTPTGVCPSLHVAYSVGIGSVFWKQKDVPIWWKHFMVLAVITISISTAFVKQHSCVDILAALPVCLVAELLVYGKWWKEKFLTKKQKWKALRGW